MRKRSRKKVHSILVNLRPEEISSVIKEQITRVGKYTVKLFVKDSSWAAENSLMITKSFDVTILGVIDTDPTNNIEGVAETVKCILRFNW